MVLFGLKHDRYVLDKYRNVARMAQQTPDLLSNGLLQSGLLVFAQVLVCRECLHCSTHSGAVAAQPHKSVPVNGANQRG
jgi:hypothetical protein